VEWGGAIHAGKYYAQTFTPSVGGPLDHVDFMVDNFFGPPDYPSTAQIVETVGGQPTGDVLGTVSFTAPAAGWYSLDFAPEGVELTSGILYGIVLANDDPNYNSPPTLGCNISWGGDPYAGGILWEWTPAGGWEYGGFGPGPHDGISDMAFRTWMVPDPATFALLALGGLAAIRRRR